MKLKELSTVNLYTGVRVTMLFTKTNQNIFTCVVVMLSTTKNKAFVSQ